MQEQEVIIHREPTEIVIHKPSPVVRDDEFLKNYEIKNWEFSPRIYKILAASAIFNILALLVFAQTNILQARACDSPWVGRVCQVIDTVYVGSTILNTDGEYVSKDYEKTELEDAEIVWINQTGNDPITYPEGYFALANPEQFQTMMQDPTLATSGFENYQNYTPPTNNFPAPTTVPIPPSSSGLPPQKLPPAAISPITIPDSAEVNNPNAKNTRKGNGKPENNKPNGDSANNKTDESKVDEKTATNSDPVKAVELNKKPFQDLGKFVSTKWSFDPSKPDNKVELKPFQVALNAKLTKKLVKDEDGKDREVVGFDKTSRWNTEVEAGDPEMIEIARQAIEAVGDSGFLGHLYNLEMRELKITLIQKDDKVFVAIESEQATEQRARTLASGLNGLLALAQGSVKGEDEKLLVSSAQDNPPTAKGKILTMNIEIPKNVVQDLIIRKLADEAKKEAEKQKANNSAAQTTNTSLKTGK